MPEPADVRALTLADLPAYKALRDEMLAAFPEAFTSDAETELSKPPVAYANRIDAGPGNDGDRFTLGAWHRDALVGAISVERERRLKVRHIGHVVGMMVRGDLAGQGIGRTLLDATIDRCRGIAGLELLTLSVTDGNGAALHLYERAGFHRYGLLPNAIKLGDRYLDKAQLVLRL